MAENSIQQIKTVDVEGPNGPAVAMMVAVDVNDLGTATDFVSTVAEQFKVQRMLAPPETTLLLITLVGDLSAEVFAEHWKALAKGDPALHAFMQMMTLAEVVQGSATGEQLGKASLI